jgi:hypothetical protein
MRSRIEDKERTILASRAVLSDVESVHDADMLRAIGFAGLFASAKGKEVEILIGMRDAARDAGEMIFAEILSDAIERIQNEV